MFKTRRQCAYLNSGIKWRNKARCVRSSKTRDFTAYSNLCYNKPCRAIQQRSL